MYQVIKDEISNTVSIFCKSLYSTPNTFTKVFNVAHYITQKKVKKMISQSLQMPSNCTLNLEQQQAIQKSLK